MCRGEKEVKDLEQEKDGKLGGGEGGQGMDEQEMEGLGGTDEGG